MRLRGKFQAAVKSANKVTLATFYVTDQPTGSLLSCETSIELGILQLQINSLSENVNNPPTSAVMTATGYHCDQSSQPDRDLDTKRQIQSHAIETRLQEKYPEVFEGIGQLRDNEQKLHIDPSIPPVSQTGRRTPFHLRKQLDVWLDDYVTKDIIEAVQDESTDWVSGLVVAPKHNNLSEVRVCGDYRQANKAIKRERHPIPTVDELLQDMSGATKFSKVDLKAGYHQILLDKESRSITTFTTHCGLFRYKRLPFGISAASEVFQNAIQNALQGLEGTRNIAEDIILWGSTNKEHDDRLNALFARLSSKGLTVNPTKCLYKQESLWFYGYILTSQGLQADKKKIAAIQNTTVPQDVTQLRSFLGLANYCARFIRNFPTLTAPLRDLTKKGVKYEWTPTQQQAFEQVKDTIMADCLMAYYDPQKKTTLTVDASPYGLGAILSNVDKDGTARHVAYASRSLTEVEQKYSHTEKEALAVVWRCERFHIYLIGTKFDLFTDHKALEVIFTPTSKPPARIER